MANEAVIIEKFGGEKGRGQRLACADINAIAKGALQGLVDSRTASGSPLIPAQTGCPFAGIASTEKKANDEQTTIGLDTLGIYGLYAGEAIPCGYLVVMSGANSIRKAIASDILSGCVIGKALATATALETIPVMVGVL